MSLRDLIFQHFWLKLFAVLMATLIWFAVESNRAGAGGGWGRSFRAERTQRVDDVPINVMKELGDTRSVNLNPSVASVRLAGPVGLVSLIRPQEIHLFVRLVKNRPAVGSFVVEMQPIHGITAVQIFPASVVLGESDLP